MNIRVFANAAHIMSGGEKIYLEYAKRWKAAGHSIVIAVNPVGLSQCIDHGVNATDVVLWSPSFFDRCGVLVTTLIKTVSATWRVLGDTSHFDVYFTSSFTWPDALPGFIAKLKHPSSLWL